MNCKKITNFKKQVKVGDMITCKLWHDYYNRAVKVTAIGEDRFLGKDKYSEIVYSINSDWLLLDKVEKK